MNCNQNYCINTNREPCIEIGKAYYQQGGKTCLIVIALFEFSDYIIDIANGKHFVQQCTTIAKKNEF